MSATPTYYVHILTSGTGGTLYIGVTNELTRSIWKESRTHPRAPWTSVTWERDQAVLRRMAWWA